MDIIKRLAEKRRFIPLSQEFIADKLGVTLTTIHRWETGKRSIPLDMAVLYAEALGFELKLIVKE